MASFSSRIACFRASWFVGDSASLSSVGEPGVGDGDGVASACTPFFGAPLLQKRACDVERRADEEEEDATATPCNITCACRILIGCRYTRDRTNALQVFRSIRVRGWGGVPGYSSYAKSVHRKGHNRAFEKKGASDRRTIAAFRMKHNKKRRRRGEEKKVW